MATVTVVMKEYNQQAEARIMSLLGADPAIVIRNPGKPVRLVFNSASMGDEMSEEVAHQIWALPEVEEILVNGKGLIPPASGF